MYIVLNKNNIHFLYYVGLHKIIIIFFTKKYLSVIIDMVPKRNLKGVSYMTRTTHCNSTSLKTRLTRLIAIAAMLLVIVSLFSTTNTAYAESGLKAGSTAYACPETFVNLRDAPQGNIIGEIPRGTKVTIVSSASNGYYYVKVNGGYYYVYGQYLTSSYIEPSKRSIHLFDGTSAIQQPTTTGTNQKSNTKSTDLRSSIVKSQREIAQRYEYAPTIYYADQDYVLYYDDAEDYTDYEGKVMFVNVKNRLNLRRKPAEDAARIRFLLRGEVVTIYPNTRKGNFVKVTAWLDGKQGWVHKSYLSEDPIEDILYVGYWHSDTLVSLLGEDKSFEEVQCECACQDENCEEWQQMFNGN